MLAITDVNVVMKDHLIFDGYVLIDGGRILDYGRMEREQLPAGAERLDGRGLGRACWRVGRCRVPVRVAAYRARARNRQSMAHVE